MTVAIHSYVSIYCVYICVTTVIVRTHISGVVSKLIVDSMTKVNIKYYNIIICFNVY